MNNKDDSHFKEFALQLEHAIAKYGTIENFWANQKDQLERLIALEVGFRKALIKHRSGRLVYAEFIDFICDVKRNILAARPYFRERQEKFTAHISGCLKTRNAKGLYRFAFNFQFVLFVMKARKWGPSSKIGKLFQEIKKLRSEIVVINMPLAISRARIFYSRTPKSHLSYMDLIQVAAEGLMSGIDKYSPGDDGVVPKIFRSTAMGRMSGNMIQDYSETLLHFYPNDKRKIYRANKVVGKFVDVVDFDKVADSVNTDVDLAHRTNSSEISELMSAASCLSLDYGTASTNDEMKDKNLSGQWDVAPDEVRPDFIAEKQEIADNLESALATLSVFERKLLRLKGIELQVSL